MATERMCLQRPPSDGKERCSKTFYSNRKKTFYMCFCKGDLCNGGGSIFTSTSAPTIFSITGLVIFFTLYILSAWYIGENHKHTFTNMNRIINITIVQFWSILTIEFKQSFELYSFSNYRLLPVLIIILVVVFRYYFYFVINILVLYVRVW